MTTVNADFVHEDYDNNYKTETIAGVSNLKPFEDNFGYITTSQWTDGALGIRTEGGTVSKSSNKCRIKRNTGSTEKSRYTGLAFGDFDYYITTSLISTSGGSFFGFWCFVDINNMVSIYYDQVSTLIRTVKVVGGSTTVGPTYSTSSVKKSFRIQRVGNDFNFYYDAAGGVSWTLLWTTTATIGTTSRLSMVNWGSEGANVIDYDNFKYLSGSYYWNDSPETHLITTGQTYLVDAGVGKTLKYNSQTATETLGSGSNIKYKWASDANGNYATASFNATWLTAAELDAALLANNGSFDRYLYIKAQYNSTGAGASLIYSIEWEEYTTGSGTNGSGTNVFGMGKNIFGKIINSRRIISALKQLLAA